MAILPKNTLFALVLALSLVCFGPLQARKYKMSSAERKLLKQDGSVNLRKHPNPRALKKTWFWTQDEAEKGQALVSKSVSQKAKKIKKKKKNKTVKKKITKKKETRKKNRPDRQRYVKAANLLARRIIQKDTPRALKEAKKLKQKYPEIALRLSQRLWAGWLRQLLFEGDDAQAQGFLKVLLALDPEDSQAHEALGALQWRAGKDAAAARHYRLALRLDPDKDYLRKRLRRMGLGG